MRHRTGTRLGGCLLAATVLLTACGGPAPGADPAASPPPREWEQPPSALHGTVLNPPMDRPTQTLQTTDGEGFSLAQRPDDEVTVVFFGYTHCPDVCPTTMADLATTRRRLPPEVRDQVAVVFITEDPRRDTPATLRRWLDRFDRSIVGLRGGNRATKAMLDELHLPQTKKMGTPETPVKHPHTGRTHQHHGAYGIEHAGIVYAFGPGDRTVIYTGGTTPAEYEEDFISLAAGAAKAPGA